MTRPLARVAALVLCACTHTACATVRPYERELLADPRMALGGDPADGALDHALSYREGAGGQSTVQGGGCGCN